ncbi:hypothetical protein HOY80DRAFT_979328 [Tuber brumale]|nr:hypothetical protein HOY80DRAFT_979328 [Tuber brumale]
MLSSRFVNKAEAIVTRWPFLPVLFNPPPPHTHMQMAYQALQKGRSRFPQRCECTTCSSGTHTFVPKCQQLFRVTLQESRRPLLRVAVHLRLRPLSALLHSASAWNTHPLFPGHGRSLFMLCNCFQLGSFALGWVVFLLLQLPSHRALRLV